MSRRRLVTGLTVSGGLAGVALAAVLLLVCAGPAFAHNAIVGSDPAESGTITAGQPSLVISFEQPVPLDTASVEFIDPATGVRSPAVALAHGASTRQVVVGVPQVPAGPITARWRLVGSDGHVVTGRISLVVTGATAPPVAGPAPVSGPPTTAPEVAATPSVAAAPGSWATPAVVGWMARTASYGALVAAAGIVATGLFVWPTVLAQARLRAAAIVGAAVVAGLAAVQLGLLAGDIAGRPPSEGLSGLAVALRTDVGTALAARVVLGAGLAGFLALTRPHDRPAPIPWAGFVVGLLATWAFAGHGWSLRWPVLGVVLDLVHHAGAVTWLGGLAAVGLVALRVEGVAEVRRIVDRFARVAAVAVAGLAVTGLLQTVRLVDGAGGVLAGHGRLVLVKLALLGLMLKVAGVNRSRVRRLCAPAVPVDPELVGRLRRAMATELVAGLAVLAVTAVLVVTTPGS